MGGLFSCVKHGLGKLAVYLQLLPDIIRFVAKIKP
jgi:hypothetical protein